MELMALTTMTPFDFQQVCVLLALTESAKLSGVPTASASRVRTRAAPQAVPGPAEGAGAAGAVPAA